MFLKEFVDGRTDACSNSFGLGAFSMLNFHRDLGAIPKGLGASLMYFKGNKPQNTS